MESQVSEERMKLEQHLAKVCDKNGSREEARNASQTASIRSAPISSLILYAPTPLPKNIRASIP